MNRIYSNFKNEVLKNKVLFMMILPAVVYFIVLKYIPLYGTIVAFQQYNYRDGIFKSPWVGLRNFEYLFAYAGVWALILRTVIYNLFWIFLNIVVRVAVAILINEMAGKLIKRFCQSAMLLPHFISFVIVGTFAYNFLNYEYGAINNFLKSINIEKIDFYGTPWLWPIILTIVQGWKSLGYGVVLYLAAIVGIDKEYYEAAQIDGASLMQQIFNITIPFLKPTIVILTIMAVGGMFYGQFELFFQLVGYNTQLYNVTDVIDTYVFRTIVRTGEFETGAAIGLMQSLFGLVSVIITNNIVKKVSSDNRLF